MKKTDLLKIGGLGEFLLDLVGEEGIKIVGLLANKGVVDEFQIAEELEKEVNSVRSLLYKLYSKKMVSYTKERDEDKGWWIYSWELHPNKIVNLLLERKEKELAEVESKLRKKEGSHNYMCPVCLIVFPFSEAMENTFQCPSCAGPLEHKSDQKEVKVLKGRRKALKRDIKQLKKVLD